MKRLLDHLKDGDKRRFTRLDELHPLPGLPQRHGGDQDTCRRLKGSKPQAPLGFAHHLSARSHAICASLAAGTAIGARMRASPSGSSSNFLRDQSPVPNGSPIQTMLDRVRNLVLLAEERDLRQVPDAALQMNAVRLMTIHGSKGLEFEAVHIPGLTCTVFPQSRGSDARRLKA